MEPCCYFTIAHYDGAWCWRKPISPQDNTKVHGACRALGLVEPETVGVRGQFPLADDFIVPLPF